MSYVLEALCRSSIRCCCIRAYRFRLLYELFACRRSCYNCGCAGVLHCCARHLACATSPARGGTCLLACVADRTPRALDAGIRDVYPSQAAAPRLLDRCGFCALWYDARLCRLRGLPQTSPPWRLYFQSIRTSFLWWVVRLHRALLCHAGCQTADSMSLDILISHLFQIRTCCQSFPLLPRISS